MTDSITSLPAAVAAVGALPVPVGDQPQPLDDTRLAEYAELIARTTPVGAATASPGMAAALLAEVQRLRAERHTTNEALSDAAEQLRANRDRIVELEAEQEKLIRWHREDGTALDRMRRHITELRENLRAVTAGWEAARTRIAELERPAVEAKRDEVRQSYAELAAQCREDRDHEGAFDVECRLREREEQWKREDANLTTDLAEEA